MRKITFGLFLFSAMLAGMCKAEQPVHRITASVYADLPSSEAWQILQDFSLAHHYVSGIVDTELVTDQRNGAGAHRRVYDEDGDYTDETIIEWSPPSGFLMRLHRGDDPLPPFSLSKFRYQLAPEGAGTRLLLSLSYRMRGGLLGEKLGQWFLADMAEENLALTAAGMKHFYETGQTATAADRERWRDQVSTRRSASDSADRPVEGDDLLAGFREPVDDVRPRVWWHWLNGAISEEGVAQDLNWMHRIGLAGVQIFNGAMPNNDGVIDPPVDYLSARWREIFRGAVSQADKQDMEVVLPTSAGWSETGAPFVQPADGMKKLVWSETEVTGGKPVAISLPSPPTVSGPFATVSAHHETLTGQNIAIPNLYRDTRVIAYRLPAEENPLPLPRVRSSAGEVSAEGLFDGKLDKAIELPSPSHASSAWVQFDYPEPVTLRSFTVALNPEKPMTGTSAAIPARLEVSDDGQRFRKVADIAAGEFVQNTTSFEGTSGRSFRVIFQPHPPEENPLAGIAMAPGALMQPGLPNPAVNSGFVISELAPHGAARVHRFEEKAGFASVPDYHAVATPEVGDSLVINEGEVIDITEYMDGDGELQWAPPPGRWRVLRMGYSLTGHVNGPAPVEGTGLEVDKLSAPRVRNYMETYLAQFQGIVGPELIGGQGIQGVLSDSFEAGFANWTDDILEQFAARRGYDPTPFLPALTGRVVGSASVSDAFLYDFRATIAELLAEAHYGSVAEVAGEHGLSVYGEALESGARPTLGDDLAMRKYTDVPMGAMWTFPLEAGPSPAHVADLKGAASVANLYGKRFVGAESFSSMFQPWAHSPRELKHVADHMLALGVNRFVIHSSVHQPLPEAEPGLSLWIFGQYFNRNETWAEQAGPWIDYLARSSWLLSRGRYVADVAYFYGEEAPLVTLSERGQLADLPTRHGFDFVNAEALSTVLSVEKGYLVSPSGMRYRVLQLGRSARVMTLATLKRLEALVKAGATVVGERPLRSPSLADDPVRFRQLADSLWGGEVETRLGEGRVISGRRVDEVLVDIGIPPDLEALGDADMPLLFQHRALEQGDIWFLYNPSMTPYKGDVAFRVAGRSPELWDATTGDTSPLAFRVQGERTRVPMQLDAGESAMVVFRTRTEEPSRAVASTRDSVLMTLDEGWSVRFQPGRGAPQKVVTMNSGSWTGHEEPGIQYFSGSASYTKMIQVPETDSGQNMILDLGEVGDMAQVLVNGSDQGTLWHPPYRVDITDALGPGENLLEVRVTNRWVNRLIGDARGDAGRVTWTVAPVYAAEAPLLPAGLLGPVRLLERD